MSKGLGGVAATHDYVIVSGRELNDTADVWRCYHAQSGEPKWAVRYPAPGALDFGNSPRATPLIHGDRVFLYGAFGHLHAVELATGKVLWKMDTHAEFGEADDLKWGQCGSPLMAGGNLIVNVGGTQAGLVALDPNTGKVVWKSVAGPPGYGSMIAGTFGGVEQVIGHDQTTLGGWDATNGKRLWTVQPDRPKDFNVPTPIAWEGHLIVSTENNGTRMFRFKAGGVIDPIPVAAYAELAPDTHTPVVAGSRLIGVHNAVHCLDLRSALKPVWVADGEDYTHYAAVVASDSRALLITMFGELVLIDPRSDKFAVLGKTAILDDERDFFSHPAIVGNRMYARGGEVLACLTWE